MQTQTLQARTMFFRQLPAVLWLLVLLSGLPSPAGAEGNRDYPVGGGDILKLSVYGHPDLTTTVRVGQDGMIGVPLLGQVRVSGLTVSQIADKLAGLFADGYLIDPQVSVFVEEFRSKKVIILGQLNKPGLYELRGRTTLLELISKAGGLTENAGDRAVIKRRAGPGDVERDVIVIDMKRLVEQGDTSLNIQVQDGDSIYITKAGVFYVTGEVEKPDAYRYEETTVIKAITMAGGLTDKASPRNIRIIRKTGRGEEVLEEVKMDQPVLPGDVIVVPESFF